MSDALIVPKLAARHRGDEVALGGTITGETLTSILSRFPEGRKCTDHGNRIRLAVGWQDRVDDERSRPAPEVKRPTEVDPAALTMMQPRQTLGRFF